MEYKLANNIPDILDTTTSVNEDKYIPQEKDLPTIYLEISNAFNEKNSDQMISRMNKLITYLLSLPITNPAEFQDNLFPVITGLCSVTDNDAIVLYGFRFMNFIIGKFIDYMPSLKEPNLFDFCSPFLNNPNYEIVCLVFDIIVNFIRIQEDQRGRDYVLNALSVDFIIQQFIETDSIADADIKLSIQSKAFHLLRTYTDYPLNQDDVSTIFKLCEAYLDEGSYWHLTGDSLSILLHFLQQYTEFQEFVLQHPEFSEKIVRYAYSQDPNDIINTLHILRFFIANNVEIPKQFFNNFLTLLIHIKSNVCSAAMEVLQDMISPEKTNYIFQLIESDFFDKIESIFKKSSYEIKYKAVEIATVLLKQSTRIISDCIFLKKQYNILHCYLLFTELEDDSLSLFLLDTLYEVFSFHQYDSPTLFHEIGDEKDLISVLIESENQEIAEKAQMFYEQLLEPRLLVENPKPVQVNPKPNVYFGQSTRRRRIKKKEKVEETQKKVRKPLLIMSDPAFRRKQQQRLLHNQHQEGSEDHFENEFQDEDEYNDKSEAQDINDYEFHDGNEDQLGNELPFQAEDDYQLQEESEYQFEDGVNHDGDQFCDLFEVHFGHVIQNEDEDEDQFEE